jgi:hypothetical protein
LFRVAEAPSTDRATGPSVAGASASSAGSHDGCARNCRDDARPELSCEGPYADRHARRSSHAYTKIPLTSRPSQPPSSNQITNDGPLWSCGVQPAATGRRSHALKDAEQAKPLPAVCHRLRWYGGSTVRGRQRASSFLRSGVALPQPTSSTLFHRAERARRSPPPRPPRRRAAAFARDPVCTP